MFDLRKLTLAAMLAPALASCGGGGGGGGLAFDSGGTGSVDTGVGGSGGIVGPAQGFGSIIINDVTMNTDAADFEIEGQPAGMGPAGQNALAEGQQLVVLGDIENRTADEVRYRSDVRGPVEGAPAIDPLTGVGSFVALGQQVKVNAVTRYAGGAAPDLLQSGDLVEISGVRDASGVLVATYVELDTGISDFKAVGMVSAGRGTGFTVGGLDIDVQSAAGQVNPAVGDRVEVDIDGAAYVPGAPAPATEVEALSDIERGEGERFEVEGLIDAFVSPNDFSVNGFDVDVPSAAVFENGNPGDLGLNVRVEVEGTIDAVGDLVAERIVFKSSETIRVEARVAPGGVDLAAETVTTVVGITFEIRGLTELEDDTGVADPFTLDDLGAGDFVEVRGFLDGAAVVAAELERDDPDDTSLRAPADSAPATDAGGNLQLSLLGVTVLGADGQTVFTDADGNSGLSQRQFAALVGPGVVVEASWNTFSSGAVADELTIEDDD